MRKIMRPSITEAALLTWYYLNINKQVGGTYDKLADFIASKIEGWNYDKMNKRGARIQRELQRMGLPFKIVEQEDGSIRLFSRFVCRSPVAPRDPFEFADECILARKAGRNWIA